MKLTVTQEQARAEAAALAMWEHTSAAVRLLDADFDTALWSWSGSGPRPICRGDDPVAVEVAADLLTRLHQASAAAFPFPALEETYGHLEDQARENAAYEQRTRHAPARGEAGVQRLDTARAAAMRLCPTAGRTVVLHGDFLDKNLLHRARRWAAVWAVLQTCHAWREDQSDLETCLASSEFEHLRHAGEGE